VAVLACPSNTVLFIKKRKKKKDKRKKTKEKRQKTKEKRQKKKGKDSLL